jgi:hypothetical protein
MCHVPRLCLPNESNSLREKGAARGLDKFSVVAAPSHLFQFPEKRPISVDLAGFSDIISALPRLN